MPTLTVNELVQALRDSQFLEEDQWRELPRDPSTAYDTPRSFAQTLLYKGWITPYQVEEIIAGRVASLTLGPYLILERIGEGGMGQVFKAVHKRLQRTVALKVIRQDRLDKDPAAVMRFRREANVSAQMTHPNVVVIYDVDQVGETHFIAMEFVDGIDLARMIKQFGPLPVRTACDFIRQAALGLHHAYECGLVHRDIKPSNLLATTPKVARTPGKRLTSLSPRLNAPLPHGLAGGQTVIKILDMGLARLVSRGEHGEDSDSLTDAGAVVGTPDYIAPEQARNSRTVDIRADLYSLGCTFYFLLTGHPPFPKGTTIEKMLMHQLDHPAPVNAYRLDIPDDVAQIIDTLMAKDPANRYQVPDDLARDLGVLLGNAVAPLPVVGAEPTSGSSGSYSGVTSGVTTAVTPERNRATSVAENPANHPGSTVVTDILMTPGPPPPAVPAPGSGSNPSSPVTAAAPGVEPIGVLTGHKGQVLSLAFAPGGLTLASGGIDAVVQIWDLSGAEPKLQARLEGHRGDVTALAFGPSGSNRLATGSGTLDGIVWLWDLGGPTPQPTGIVSNHGTPVNAICFSPSGKLVALGCNDKTARLIDVSRQRPCDKSVLRGHASFVSAVEFPAGEKVLVSGSEDGSIRAWKLGMLWTSAWEVLPIHAGPIYSLCCNPPGTMVASGSLDKTVRLVDLSGSRPQQVAVLKGHEDSVRLVAFFDKGTSLVSMGSSGRVVLWDVAAGKIASQSQLPRDSRLNCVAFSPDRKLIAAGTTDGTTLLYRLNAGG